MKVVFLEDVPNVAEAGEIKEVANGYGRNFLIPRKLAILANTAAVNSLEIQRRIKARSQAETEAEMLELAHQLEGQEVILKAKVGAKDRLYGSITSADIIAELENTAGLVVDKRKMELTEPIRQLGSHEVVIRLTKDIVPKIKVTVTEEETEKAKDIKETKKETKETKKTWKAKETKETGKAKEAKKAKDIKETKKAKEAKKAKDIKETKKETKETKKAKDIKETKKETKETKEETG